MAGEMNNTMALADFEFLCSLAREFNEYVPAERFRGSTAPAPSNATGDRPGDDFNRRANWQEILEPHGWTVAGTAGETTYWTRPGKSRRDGISATTGRCRTEQSGDLFYNFSTGGAPFDADTAYSKFAAHTLLNHGGDFAASASGLREGGYGRPPAANGHIVPGLPAALPATPRPPWTPTTTNSTSKAPVTYTIPELLGLELPMPRWAIPGLLSEGFSILAGKPKLGKSWMALNLALTIAAGGKALGNIQVQAGDVLYLALEDRLRRIRDRAAKVMKGIGMTAPHRLSVAVEWKRQDKGGVHDLAEWLSRATDPRLVVIDVWAKFHAPAKSKGSAYDQDYEQATEVKSVADHYGASVLVLHHTRKSAAEDVFDEISGTLGFAGAADGAMVLARNRGHNEGTLAMTGRDIEEQKLAVEFNPEAFTWKSLGSAEERLTGDLQLRVIDYMKRMLGRPLYAADIAEHLSEPPDNVRKTLHRLLDKNIIRHVGHTWSYPGEGEESGAE